MLIRRVVLLSASLLLSLFIVEIILGKFFPQKTYSYSYENAISCFSKSDLVVFTLKPNCTIPFTDFDTNESFTTRTNSLGYRGEDFSLKKPPGERRILFEGDSFILGFGVRDEMTVTSQLANELGKIDRSNPFYNAKVINAGYSGGFGPDGYFLHLKETGMKLEPDLVVFSIFVYNDLSDIDNDEWIGTGKWGEPNKVISKTTVVDEDGHLIPKDIPLIYRVPIIRDSHVAVLSAKILTAANAYVKHVFDRVRFTIKTPIMPTGEARDTNLPGAYFSSCIFGTICHRRVMHLFTDLLSTIKASSLLANDLYKDGKPHFLVLLIPSDFQIYPDAAEKYQDTGIPYGIAGTTSPNPQKRIKEMLEKEKIPHLDLLPAFRKSDERLYFKTDGHWNSKGHTFTASLLISWIEENYK